MEGEQPLGDSHDHHGSKKHHPVTQYLGDHHWITEKLTSCQNHGYEPPKHTSPVMILQLQLQPPTPLSLIVLLSLELGLASNAFTSAMIFWSCWRRCFCITFSLRRGRPLHEPIWTELIGSSAVRLDWLGIAGNVMVLEMREVSDFWYKEGCLFWGGEWFWKVLVIGELSIVAVDVFWFLPVAAVIRRWRIRGFLANCYNGENPMAISSSCLCSKLPLYIFISYTYHVSCYILYVYD